MLVIGGETRISGPVSALEHLAETLPVEVAGHFDEHRLPVLGRKNPVDAPRTHAGWHRRHRAVAQCAIGHGLPHKEGGRLCIRV